MMKSRTLFFVAIVLFILGITIFAFTMRNHEPAQVFAATVNRDCAPWDGSAFTVSVPMSDRTEIDISIWQAPEIKFPLLFKFPDGTGQVGYASSRSYSGEYEQLNGTVFFWRVEERSSVEGRFDFVTETGEHSKGRFEAEWGDQVALCG